MTSHSSNRNIIIFSAIISILVLIYGIFNFYSAFPEIAINFSLSRKATIATARDFLIGRHFDLADYHETIKFTYDNQAKLFMEKELGVKRTVEMTQDSIDVWYWRVRFFKPLEKLEYTVNVDPRGRVIGFQRQMLEAVDGPILEAEAAQILGEAFITGPMGENLTAWELVETDSYDRPNRRDHCFTYKLKGLITHGATYRMEVEVQGAEVGMFKRHLEVPQQWEREFSQLRSQNETYQSIATFLYIVFSVILCIYFILHIRNRQIPWRTALILSMILAAATAVTVLNSLPLTTAVYDTTESYIAFISKQILTSVLSGLGVGVMLMLMFGAGEPLYRRDNPNKLFIPMLFSRRGYRSREFVQATVMGYLLAAFHVGYVVIFYVIGNRVGFWSPAGVEYDNAVSTIFPWIFPLVLSMTASLSEEFWFRLFGIAFFRRLFRSTTLAVIFQAFLWGFLHSNYPQQPGFVRGIEVGLIGIVAGVVMLRFGIWATLTWHFVVDAIFIGLFLFQSDNAYFWISGLIVCAGLAIPALLATIQYLKRRRFEAVDDLLNREVDRLHAQMVISGKMKKDTEEENERETSVIYQPLSSRIKRIALIFGAIGILLALLPRTREFGDDIALHIDKGEAIETASAAIEERYGISADSFKTGIVCSYPFDAKMLEKLSYLKKHVSPEEAENIVSSSEGEEMLYWLVSFKRELDPEYFYVWVSQKRGEYYATHILPDSASGADLSPEEANQIAERAFYEVESYPEIYKLVDGESEKHPNRRDYIFTWETIEPVAGDAHFRRIIRLKGDEVQLGRRTLKVPEEWTRDEKERGLRWTLMAILQTLLLLGCGLIMIKKLGKRVATRNINWRMGLTAGIAVFLLSIFDWCNDLVSYWFDYSTNIPVSNYMTVSFLSQAAGAILVSLFVAVLVTVANTLASFNNGMNSLPFHRNSYRTVYGDGIILTISLLGIGFGLSWLLVWLESVFNLPVHSFSLNIPGSLDSYQPWFGIGFSTFINTLIFASLIMIGYMIITICFRQKWLRILILCAVSVVAADFISASHGNLTTGETLWSVTRSITVVFAGYYVIKHLVGGRLWVLIAAGFTGGLVESGTTFLSPRYSPYFGEGLILLVLAALPLVGMALMMVRARRNG